MTFITELRQGVERLAAFAELDVDASTLPASAMGLSDQSVRDLIADTARIARDFQKLQAVLAGVVAHRSTRERGHGGLAATGGFRTPADLISTVTGVTKAEATRAVKVGESLLDGGPQMDAEDDAAPVREPWHQPLRSSLLAGGITQAQYSAILRGLGEPPLREGLDPDAADEAWRLAAERLVEESGEWSVEQLEKHARTLRDLLDEEGAQERLNARFAKRSYKVWHDADGMLRASIVFDDEGGQWAESVFDAALRPRRGGPRFISDDKRQEAEELAADPRTPEQLAYDLFLDLFIAGARADVKDVFGARDPGVRLVVIKDAVTGETAHRDVFGRLIAVGHTEDGGESMPGSLVERALCLGGSVDVTVDTGGNPLDLGRRERLFGETQRLTMAVRDGGCLWPGCDRPPSYCEAHHCNPWSEGGETNCDVGVLLCRFHHLNLHNNGWRITRDGRGEFLLHPPVGGEGAGFGFGDSASGRGEPVALKSKSPLRWRWDPPPERRGWRKVAVA